MSPYSRITVLAICLSACSLLHAQDAKWAAPTDQQRTATLELLQEIYRADYVAAKTPDQKSALAKRISKTANETKNDPVARFVMLRLAIDIAVQAGDAETIFEAVDVMAKHYQINDADVRFPALQAAVKRVTPSFEDSMHSIVIDYCRAQMAANQFDNASQLLATAGKHFQSEQARADVKNLHQRITQLASEYATIKDAMKRLQEDPSDGDANLAVGKFLCFTKGDWAKGLGNLANSSDDTLKRIAALEATAGDDFQRQVTIADQWWNYASELQPPDSNQVKLHAASFYGRAAASLQGLQKAKANKRIAEAKALGTDQPNQAANATDDAPPMLKPMAEKKLTIDLPASFDEVVVGGSGRYLVFLLGTLKKLAFFDVYQREITEYVPVESSDVRFTVGADAFYIAYRPQNVIERWSLKTFKKEAVVKLPLEHPVAAVMTGFAATGPVYAGASNAPGIFLHPRSMKVLPFQVADHNYQKAGEVPGADDSSRMRASANGKSFSFWRTAVSPGGFRVLVLADRLAHMYYDHDTMGYIAPSPDGDLMYTSKGVFTYQTKPFSGEKGLFAQSFPVPAVSGNYSISVTRDDKGRDKNKKTTSVHVHVNGQRDPILTLPDITLRPGGYSEFHNRERVTLDKRIYFVPHANLLITLPTSNKSVVLHRLNLEEELAASGIDYLFVVSQPPASVRTGGVYKYQIDAKSRKGGVQYELVSGPNGMKVSNSGLVTWRTPRRGAESQDVIVVLKDAGGQESTHTFKVTFE